MAYPPFCADWLSIYPILTKFIRDTEFDVSMDAFRRRFDSLSRFAQDFYKRNALKPTFLPNIVDVCGFPEVRSFVWDIPFDPTRADVRTRLEPIFSNLLARWRTEVEGRLAALITTQLRLQDGDVCPLKLAAAIFKCTKCDVARTYPAVLSHKCLYDIPKIYETRPVSFEMRLEAVCRLRPWSCDVLDLTSWARRVENVITACGGHPKISTSHELDLLDPRLACQLCRRPGQKVVMTWRAAVSIQPRVYIMNSP
jgi:hypothetical protein